jgi:catechol 2,3-dioxygenase-like lactoylglutathione lyase family enzyme
VKAKGILESSLYCRDLEAAEKFYSQVLGLQIIGSREGRHVFFRCGSGVLLIFNPEATLKPPASSIGTVAPHGAEGPGHLAFAASADEIEEWKRHLQFHQVPLESEVNWPHGGQSIYFRDPAGNSLEFATPELWQGNE